MLFTDRRDAGRRLADRLEHLKGHDLVVLGLPRGGVPVAAEVAQKLGAPLDVVLVRKLGVPFQPELGMGAIGEEGVRVVNDEVVRATGITPEQLSDVEARELVEMRRRADLYRAGRPSIKVSGRTVLIIDDGIATGSTARAACLVTKARGAAHVILATPVAPRGWTARLEDAADELVCVDTPRDFYAIGQFYRDFRQTTDEEVIACLAENPSGPPPMTATSDPEVTIPVGAATLSGTLAVPEAAKGIVVFAHGSGSSRHSPRNRYVAERLNRAGLATLLFDLLTEEEELDRANVFDIELLAERLDTVTRWPAGTPETAGLPVGCFGASTGAAAALAAAAKPDSPIAAVVSRGGRPDLAASSLTAVRAPTLLIVGGDDEAVLRLNRSALELLGENGRLEVIPGATHLFSEAGALEAVAELAADWFVEQLSQAHPG